MVHDATEPDDVGELDDEVLIERSAQLAAELLAESTRQMRRRDRARHRQIAHLLASASTLSFVLTLTDEVLRIRDPRRAAQRFREVVRSLAGWRSLGLRDTVLVRTGALVSRAFAGPVMALVDWRVRAELEGFVIGAEERRLTRHLREQRERGYRANINILGESVLGHDEARARLDALVALMGRSDVDYVSVKVSSVCARINQLAFDEEVERIAVGLRRLYDAAMSSTPVTFVNLDMEEYKDLEITVAVFKKVLSEEKYRDLDAGIVLQAYIPDSTVVLEDLVDWARERSRVSTGRVKVRIVKGANLAMEKVHAELAGWAVPTFSSKAEVDANYKRMLDVVLTPANASFLRVGVASHNLFEICWALVVAQSRQVASMVEFEMLQGMSPATAEAVRRLTGSLLLYTPIVRREDSNSAIAYLIRRFDENTGSENFLRNQFDFADGSDAWARESERFARSVRGRHSLDLGSRRVQDRGAAQAGGGSRAAFVNEADTDFSLRVNRSWVAAQLVPIAEQLGPVVGPRGGFDESTGPRTDEHQGVDPALPERVAYRWSAASPQQVDRAIEVAHEAARRWNESPMDARRALLERVAEVLTWQRGELISVMTRDAGKTVVEADAEVSEAIDFARYYGACVAGLGTSPPSDGRFENRGVALVVPPWNFPLAIPMSGVCAALAGGNAVLVKPAPETVAVAAEMLRVLWRAGVPEDLAQFVPTADDEVGRHLVSHPGIDLVIMTGSWDTARLFLSWRPEMRLLAETSGKNAIVVTATADLEEAVADIVRSAFGHSGQKCSAASLAIIEDSVYDDPRFKKQLVDAAASLRVGPGWDLRSDTGPLIRAPEGDLYDFLEGLDEGEIWWLRPTRVAGQANMVTPAIKAGVAPGSKLHLRETFGPVLGLMRAHDLPEAIRWQNATPFGLTAGLHALDAGEIQLWLDEVQAGNLYVNRHTTGAIVQRQPFGGWKRSAIGDGAKTGGPNYVSSMMRWSATVVRDPEDFARAVVDSWAQLTPRDRSGLASESNVLRYRKLRRVIVRVGEGVDARELAMIRACARALDVDIDVSSATAVNGSHDGVEDAEAFARRLGRLDASGTGLDKLRLVGEVGAPTRLAAMDSGVFVDDAPFVAVPQREALRWCREQSLSITAHRHGNPTHRSLRWD